MKVVSRTCPECGHTLHGRVGLPLFVCPTCPLATDLFAVPARRVQTWRPRDDPPGRLRLPFYLSRGDGAAPLWVPAFRAWGQPETAESATDRLTRLRHDPALVEAPLGALPARSEAEALSLLRARHGPDADQGRETCLVSLACGAERGQVTEPVSGWTWPADRLSPNPLAPA